MRAWAMPPVCRQAMAQAVCSLPAHRVSTMLRQDAASCFIHLDTDAFKILSRY